MTSPVSTAGWSFLKVLGVIALVILGALVLLTLGLFLGPVHHDGQVGPTTTRVIQIR